MQLPHGRGILAEGPSDRGVPLELLRLLCELDVTAAHLFEELRELLVALQLQRLSRSARTTPRP